MCMHVHVQEGSLVDLVAQRKESGEALALRDILSIFLQARPPCTRGCSRMQGLMLRSSARSIPDLVLSIQHAEG